MENAPVTHHVHARMNPGIVHVKMAANAKVHQHAAEQYVNAMIAKNAVVIPALAVQEAVLESANQAVK